MTSNEENAVKSTESSILWEYVDSKLQVGCHLETRYTKDDDNLHPAEGSAKKIDLLLIIKYREHSRQRH